MACALASGPGRRHRWLPAMVLLALQPVFLPIARADTASFRVVDGYYTNAGASFSVGESGPFNTLLVTNQGWLENGSGFLGRHSGASSNTAVVTGIASLWQNTAGLVVGQTGAHNLLIVSNGARVTAPASTLGQAAASSNNTVLLHGAGSRWDSGQLRLGDQGSGNRVIISGGAILNGSGFDVLGYGPQSRDNELVVSGAGSALLNYFDLLIAPYGSSGNRFRVAGGAVAFGTFGYFGGGSNNLAWITDPGSRWSFNESFTVGNEGAGNLLVITNGARVQSHRLSVNGSTNRLLVTGTDSLLQTSGDSGQLALGTAGNGNRLSIERGGRVATQAGYLFGASSADLADAGSTWQNDALLVMGEDFGNGASLFLENGSALRTQGLEVNGDQGRVSVVGAGTILDCASLLTVGGEIGFGNRMSILDGARVQSDSAYIGGRDSAFVTGRNTHNSVFVAGPGSRWDTTNDLALGVTGSADSLVVSNAAQVHCRNGYIAFHGYSGGGTALVTGANSIWTNRGGLFIGHAGSRNRVIVEKGGQLACVHAAVGRQYNRDNLVLLRDPGSHWRASGQVIVGNSGSGNLLLITNGASIASGPGALDAPPLTSNPGRSNHVVITGAGSRWSVAGGFTLGAASTHNSLTLADGGAMDCTSFLLGGQGASFSNFLFVADGSLTVTNPAGSAALEIHRALLSLRGGTLRADRFIADGGPASQVDFLAGHLRTASAVIANGRPFVVGDGAGANTLILDPGQHSFADGLVAPAAAELTAAGFLSGAVTNAGRLAIGAGADRLIITGDLHLADTATAEFELGGPLPGQFDFIQTSDTVRLGGMLRLRTIQGYIPASNAVLVLMQFTSLDGSFANAPNGSRVTLENSVVTCRVDYGGGKLQLSGFENAAPATNRIDDAWALQYFGHAPLSQAEEEDDPDMDGASNYEEYVAGTHPTQAASVLRITSCTVNPLGHFVVQFLCVTGETYTIGFSTGLPAWTEIVPSTLSYPAPGLCEWIDDGSQTGGVLPVPGSPHRLYRITTR